MVQYIVNEVVLCPLINPGENIPGSARTDNLYCNVFQAYVVVCDSQCKDTALSI